MDCATFIEERKVRPACTRHRVWSNMAHFQNCKSSSKSVFLAALNVIRLWRKRSYAAGKVERFSNPSLGKDLARYQSIIQPDGQISRSVGICSNNMRLLYFFSMVSNLTSIKLPSILFLFYFTNRLHTWNHYRLLKMLSQKT